MEYPPANDGLMKWGLFSLGKDNISEMQQKSI